MHFNKEKLKDLYRVRRLHLINGISGIKPANLIGTKSKIHGTNLAIFSSVVHLGSDPALLGFIQRPINEMSGNTYRNIKECGYYTINHVHHSFVSKAHFTSAKFDHGDSEFDKCHLTEEYYKDFPVPFVKESKIKIGLKFEEEIVIKSNSTRLIVGSIEEIFLPDNILDDKGYVRLDRSGGVGIGGLNSYYNISRFLSLPYARVGELPSFDE